MYEVVFMTMKLIYGCFNNAVILYIDITSVFGQLLNIINTFLAYFVLYCFVWRFWSISYEMSWTNYIIQHEWKSIINPNHTEYQLNEASAEQSNWYFDHKNTFGNQQWVKWRIFAIAILSGIIQSVCGSVFAIIFSSTLTNVYAMIIISTWPYPIPLILLIIIYYKTPIFDGDNFYVQTELKYIFVLLCINYVSFYAVGIIAIVTSTKWDNDSISDMISFNNQIIIFCQWMCVMISTAWVNYKVSGIIKEDRFKITHIDLESNAPQSGQSQRSAIRAQFALSRELIQIQPERQYMKVENSEMEAQDLTELLMNSVAFEAFMTHLCHEFSMENLLSLVEFLQFQKYMANQIGYYDDKDMNKDGNEEEEGLLCDIVVLPDIVPFSAIVTDIDLNVKEKAYALYQKYIGDESVYTINISFRVRSKLNNYMKDRDEWMENNEIGDHEMMNIFNNCCKEIRALMNDSYGRFRATTQYQKLVHSLLFIK